MHGEMKRGPMHGEMQHEYMMHKKEWMLKFLSEEDKKKLAVRKLDMKIAMAEQKVELLKLMRDMLKAKIQV